ncbi:MAG TPA: LysR substrate-binding domain-containing protein, partial [Burkholderiaceae bacterium]|nr:LysR substrate-binding domain-containing protein [Burkholderiaceae bacterium]
VANARRRSLNVRYEINDAELTRALVREGLAQALLPVNAFAATDEAPSVLALDIVEPALTRIQSLAWPAGTPLTPAADATRQCLQETVATLMEQGVLQGRLPRSASHRAEPMD